LVGPDPVVPKCRHSFGGGSTLLWSEQGASGVEADHDRTTAQAGGDGPFQ
jgi:hypothetical protein